jgi:hypothetical protein
MKVLIGEVAVLVLRVNEGEPVEHVVGAEPDELRRCRLDVMAEFGDDLLAEEGVRPVSGDDDVEVVELRERGDRRLEPQIYSGIRRGLLEDLQEHTTMDGRHAVAGEARRLALGAHLDRIPVHAVLGERTGEDRIGGVDRPKRRVREDDAESERVGRAIALEEHDVPIGTRPLHQEGEEQPTGAASYDCDLH